MKKILLGNCLFFMSAGLWGMNSGVAMPSSSSLKVPLREDIEPSIVYCSHNKKIIKYPFSELESLDKPEYERYCCFDWRPNPDALLIAAQFVSVHDQRDFSLGERARLENYVSKQSGWLWPKNGWKKYSFLGSGIGAFACTLLARSLGAAAANCVAQKKNPEEFCRTYETSSPCPYACNEDQLRNGSYAAYGVAGLACATCIGASFLAIKCGANPTLKEVLGMQHEEIGRIEMAPCSVPVVRISLPGAVCDTEESGEQGVVGWVQHNFLLSLVFS